MCAYAFVLCVRVYLLGVCACVCAVLFYVCAIFFVRGPVCHLFVLFGYAFVLCCVNFLMCMYNLFVVGCSASTAVLVLGCGGINVRARGGRSSIATRCRDGGSRIRRCIRLRSNGFITVLALDYRHTALHGFVPFTPSSCRFPWFFVLGGSGSVLLLGCRRCCLSTAFTNCFLAHDSVGWRGTCCVRFTAGRFIGGEFHTGPHFSV